MLYNVDDGEKNKLELSNFYRCPIEVYRGLSRRLRSLPHSRATHENKNLNCANHGMSRPGILLNYCVSCRNGYGGGDHRGCVPLCILDSSLAIDPSLAPFPSGPTTRGLAFCHFTSAREYPIRPGPCTKVPNIVYDRHPWHYDISRSRGRTAR